MAVMKWLLNTAGWNCEAISERSGTVPSGYDREDLLAANRAKRVRSDAATGNVWFPQILMNNHTAAATDFLEAKYCVMTRFDKIVNHQYASEMQLELSSYVYPSTYPALVDYDQIEDTSFDLMGPTGQDWCVELNSTALVRTEFEAAVSHGTGATSWAAQFHALSFCDEWAPTHGPLLKPAPRWQKLQRGFEFTPIRSTRPLECEARIQMNWPAITDSERDAWVRYEELIETWPFYLYDEDSTLWDYKLEHVILENYTWVRRADGLNDLACTFLRLRHYE